MLEVEKNEVKITRDPVKKSPIKNVLKFIKNKANGAALGEDYAPKE